MLFSFALKYRKTYYKHLHCILKIKIESRRIRHEPQSNDSDNIELLDYPTSYVTLQSIGTNKKAEYSENVSDSIVGGVVAVQMILVKLSQ